MMFHHTRRIGGCLRLRVSNPAAIHPADESGRTQATSAESGLKACSAVHPGRLRRGLPPSWHRCQQQGLNLFGLIMSSLGASRTWDFQIRSGSDSDFCECSGTIGCWRALSPITFAPCCTRFRPRSEQCFKRDAPRRHRFSSCGARARRDDNSRALPRRKIPRRAFFLGPGGNLERGHRRLAVKKSAVFAPLIRDAAGRLAFGETILTPCLNPSARHSARCATRTATSIAANPKQKAISLSDHLGAMVSDREWSSCSARR